MYVHTLVHLKSHQWDFCHITDLRNAIVACFCLAFTHHVTNGVSIVMYMNVWSVNMAIRKVFLILELFKNALFCIYTEYCSSTTQKPIATC